MKHHSNKTVRSTLRCISALSLLAVGLAGAGPVWMTQLDGPRTLTLINGDNSGNFISVPAGSMDIISTGTVSTVGISTPKMTDMTVNLASSRNEGGTLFVFLSADMKGNSAVHTIVPVTISNMVTGKSMTVNVRVNAVSAKYR